MLAVKDVPIDRIKAYENNPRRISESAVKAVINSIREFGFKVPVVIDENNVIVTGHTRLLAAREMGLTEVPCIVADDLTPEQIKAFRLADNKTSELSNWDFEKLNIELEELTDVDIDMSDFGFNIEESAQTESMSSEEVDADEFAEEKFKHECPKCGFKF